MGQTSYIDRVRELLPSIRERAAECETLRRLPNETFAAFQEAGLLRCIQPSHWGGDELTPMDFYEGVMEVGTVCPSSAWFLGVVGVHNWQLGLFPEQAQRDVWGEDSSIQISSSYAPTGQVELADNGYGVSGRWFFSSGCDHCNWVFLGGLVPSDNPIPDMRTFLIPRSDYEIIDNWHVSGLAGTGSKIISVENAFVPEHRTHRMTDAYNLDNPGQKINDGALFRLPWACVFNFALVAPAIGAAQGALDTYRSYMQNKIAAIDGAKAADFPPAQRRLAEATAQIDAAKSEMRHSLQSLWEPANAGTAVPLRLRAQARWYAANAVQRSVKAVDLLFEASGGNAIFLDNPMQRYFRDVHAMRAHAFNDPDKAAQTFGYSELHPGKVPPYFDI
ncbi:MAG: flavin-dependent monooxygenase [Gammaproteobacteria bacterium]|nr:flavin-dependent monooxygenase [Gammaproteobacteria bacterium]